MVSPSCWRKASLFLVCAGFLPACASAQDASQIWNSITQPTFDAGKAAVVDNLTLQRDRIRIELAPGTLQVTQPAGGVVSGAAFRGRGRVKIVPPNDLERRQLMVFLGSPELDLEFSEAVFGFSDNTFEEIARQVRWGGSGGDLATLYKSRQDEREDIGAEIVSQLFMRVLSGDRARSALFVGDFKTREKGWVTVRFDALNPEQVSVGRWTEWGQTKQFDTWMSFPANGVSAEEAFRDPLAKEEFLIRRYQIDATVTSSADLRATTRVTVEPRIEGDRALLFYFDANLRIDSVKDESGTALAFFQPREPMDRPQSYGDYVVVALAKPVVAGKPLTLEFTYKGKRVVRNMGGGNYFCQSFGWYPARRNAFAARSEFEITFRFPKRYTLVATGNLVSETEDGGDKIAVWKSDLPLAVAGFAFGDFKMYATKANNVDVFAYANRETDDSLRYLEQLAHGGTLPMEGQQFSVPLGSLSPANQVRPMAEEVANAIRIFERYFGPYPYSQLAVSNIPFTYGQGWPGLLYITALSFLDSTQRQLLGIQDHLLFKDFFRAHETSHQWWGHRVSWKSYHDQWLSEGFAEFSGNLYIQFRRNESVYLARLRDQKKELLSLGDLGRRRYESVGPIWMGQRLSSAEYRGAYFYVVYNKGGWVLHMLRMMLHDPRNPEPDTRFINLMQEFTRTYHNQPASTEDFKAMVEKHMTPSMDLDGNRKMDWFFHQYVYGTGIPQYEFKYQLQDAGGGRWKLTGQVTQSAVPDGWKEMLPLYLNIGGRTARVAFINVKERVTSFDLTLPAKPENVAICLKEDVLAQIQQ